jgi:hypothetical protein
MPCWTRTDTLDHPHAACRSKGYVSSHPPRTATPLPPRPRSPSAASGRTISDLMNQCSRHTTAAQHPISDQLSRPPAGGVARRPATALDGGKPAQEPVRTKETGTRQGEPHARWSWLSRAQSSTPRALGVSWVGPASGERGSASLQGVDSCSRGFEPHPSQHWARRACGCRWRLPRLAGMLVGCRGCEASLVVRFSAHRGGVSTLEILRGCTL